MKRKLCITVCLLTALAVGGQTASFSSSRQLREGDLLFCVSPGANPITDVTHGVKGRQIDHVAIVHRSSRGVYALEAIHRGVSLTPIDSFLVRRGEVLQARLRDTVGVSRSVERALHYVGRPYDFFFMPSDSAFYCSELVQKCYLTPRGKLIFKPIPMSFHDRSGRVTPYWTEYYARHGMQVPEGWPGSNPGQLSRSRKLRILGVVGQQ